MRHSVKLIIFSLLALKAGGCFAQSNEGFYKVRLDEPKQKIWGLGVEIQNDAIGSGNAGLPDKVIAIPANLVPSERKRLYHDVLKGFRYCRLAMGLYLRGLDTSRSRIQERYPNQMKDIKELIDGAGMEGISMEYWSPAPYWKSTNSYLGGTLKDTSAIFLNAFGKALSDDIKYIQKYGIKISMWGLQNEASLGGVGDLKLGERPQSYSHCFYPPQLYVKAFKYVAPYVRKAVPDALITVDSWNGNSGEAAKLIRQDTALLKYVDAWVYHRVGSNSTQIKKEANAYQQNTYSKPVYQNEFEYQRATNDSLCINTAQNIINWFVFANSSTWFWLHALKPTYNAEASGYSLGFWRPADDNDFKHNSQIRKGHWDYNPQNFNAIAGFLKYLPWNSQRYAVDEDNIRDENRILACKTPAGKMILVLTNRSQKPFLFNINTSAKGKYKGYRYTPSDRNLILSEQTTDKLRITLPPLSIEFWVQQ